MNPQQKQIWEERSARAGMPAVMSIRWSEEDSKLATQELHIEVKKLIADLELKSVTEVGCGIGRNLQFFANESIEKINGVDISQGMVDKARSNVRVTPHQSLSLSVQDASFMTDEEVEKNRADLVFTCTVVAHVVSEPDFLHLVDRIKRMSNKYVLLVEEAHSHKRQSSQYTRTDMIRSVSEYIQEMAPWDLVQLKRINCFEDGYAAMLFQHPSLKRWRY